MRELTANNWFWSKTNEGLVQITHVDDVKEKVTLNIYGNKNVVRVGDILYSSSEVIPFTEFWRLRNDGLLSYISTKGLLIGQPVRKTHTKSCIGTILEARFKKEAAFPEMSFLIGMPDGSEVVWTETQCIPKLMYGKSKVSKIPTLTKEEQEYIEKDIESTQKVVDYQDQLTDFTQEIKMVAKLILDMAEDPKVKPNKIQGVIEYSKILLDAQIAVTRGRMSHHISEWYNNYN